MESNDDGDTCWICLEGVEGSETHPGPVHANRLIKPCRCPRVVHSVCLAKWQLSQSGRSEEKFCRFCRERLPDWQSNLALPGMGAVEPVMSVHFNGQTHMVKVRPGEEGRVAFIQDVRRLLRLRDSQEFSITFECKVPGHGMFLDLKGLSSYDAAVFCAAMTAVERQRVAAQKVQQQRGAGSAPGPRGTCGLLPACSSAPAASSLAAASPSPGGSTATSNATTTTTITTTTSRSSGSGSSSAGEGAGAGEGAATSSAATSTCYTLPPVRGTSARTSTAAGSGSSSSFGPGASEADAGTRPASQTRLRTASLDLRSGSAVSAAGAGAGAGRLPGQPVGNMGGIIGGGSASGSDTPAAGGAGLSLLPSSPSAPARSSTQAGWPLQGLARSGAAGAGGPAGAASAANPGAAPAVAALSIGSSSPQRSLGGGGGGGVTGGSRSTAEVAVAGVGASPVLGRSGSTAYDSACEAEPAGAAAGGPGGAGGAGGSAAGGGTGAAAAVAAAAAGVDGRHKSFVRHLWNGHVALGGGGSLSALSERPVRRAECPSAHTTTTSGWMSRLLLCASFGADHEASR
ncbi:hypothetical protein PLESTB_000754900 [Pleodorina starrii]|uniref:RING-CH-type domain-containing protein n=1 Tax=Pleodorina starrii TaxID=330485 RepID=A0A9W6BJQ3_9CHLO|nr:hypothetical protein PLESTM_001570700 [Pleodorina starrii]GLC53486.1 hypothetical protein PLESTB_000754900 [Pleodorina starrii]GLC69777.1 hypothetical protein PLESTF_000879600 [Pleodorina starrii]